MAGKMRQARSRNGLSRAEPERQVADYELSDATREAFCAERGLSVSSLEYWWRKLRGNTPPRDYIVLGSVSAGAAAAWDVELKLGGGVVLQFRRG